MKRKKIKLSLEKEVISKLTTANIRGGALVGPCSVTNRFSDRICRSNEYNCHSNNHDCDCGTTGNCDEIIIGG